MRECGSKRKNGETTEKSGSASEDIETSAEKTAVSPKEDCVIVQSSEYERVKMVMAIIEAIHKALTPRNIMSAWRAAHLWPFIRVPPYSKKEENGLKIQIEQSALKVEKRKYKKRVTSIIGLINTPERIKQLAEAMEGKQLKAMVVTVTRRKISSVSAREEVSVFDDELSDLGDFITEETEGDTLFCDSDSIPYPYVE